MMFRAWIVPFTMRHRSSTHVWFSSGFPRHACCLTQARRFVLLIDELYERGVHLSCLSSNASSPHDLFRFRDLLPEIEEDSTPIPESEAYGKGKLRRSDDVQLSLRVLDAGLQALALASVRAVSRLIQVALRDFLAWIV
jgi:predicted ATPase